MAARDRDALRDRSDGLLITGATGFVGMEVLARYLERTSRPLYALIRAGDDAQAAARLRCAVTERFGRDDAHEGRVAAVAADLERPGLGLDGGRRAWLAERVSDIIHAAASVSFSLPLERARAINVEGTRRLADLAELCQRRGGLERFSYISTAYVAGTHVGEFAEGDLDLGQGFRNSYERSKFEAEEVVRARRGRLPLQIFRPSIIVGERRSGWTASFNVLYTPLRAFARGALPALPARRSAPVDVVPVDYVADGVFELTSRPLADEEETYHLVAGPQASTVGRLVELSARYFGRRRPLLVAPGVYRRILHPLLVRHGQERRRRALRRSEAFFPYLSMRVSYDNARARERLEPAGIRVTPIERYYGRLIDFAVRAQWGRRPIDRAQAAAG
ncbi:MAG: SDR family oxidoreductase [Solirubrobacteraceae bacterium]